MKEKTRDPGGTRVPEEIRDDPYLLNWTDEELECLGESDWPPIAATDKIEECGFFLDLMRKTTNWKQFRWLTSAFLEAARAAMDWMAFAAHHYWQQDAEGNDFYDDRYVQPLRRYIGTEKQKKGRVAAWPIDPLLKELSRHRKETAHYGPLWIKPKLVTAPSDFVFVEGDQPAVAFCEQVFELISAIPHQVHAEVQSKEYE